jgi:hypothetical protein
MGRRRGVAGQQGQRRSPIGLKVDERFAWAGSTYLTDQLGSTVALAAGSTPTIQTH